ncbi:Positive regulator of purine utilization [Zalerion maritima]|uniref:Positive regulator of purine utilization n=1 Tax=Zalerion maritima TaxID=339359 RepID=A0AAD5WMT6_9PEZI|nr:Positive regulator of purine utilization [Zalerion maritima]
MPRSSFSDNPLLRVSRPVSACSRCRSAKVKCDGKLPACTACEKAGRENACSSANDQFARGKERSYVAALELRIEKLERRLTFARSRKASVANHEAEATPTANTDRKDSLANIRAAIHRKAARKRENSDVNTLVSDFGFLSVNATTRDFEPSLSNMTFARLVLAAATNDEVPEPGEHSSLPSRQAATAIVQYYIRNIYALFPAFAESTLLTILDDVYHQDKRPIKDHEYWLFYMALAIGSTAQSRTIQDEFYKNGLEFAGMALQHADKTLTPGNATQIQSLILLTQYSMLDPAHFDSWHLIGFTARACIDLGYHQDPPPEQMPDRAALETRRRMFYCVYALDRAISMVHARAFSFTDEAINVAFPSSNPNPRVPSLSGPIAAPAADPGLLFFQLRRAQSQWYSTLFQSEPTPLPNGRSYIWRMCQEMRDWGTKLPDTLPASIRELFDLELRYSYVYCLAPSTRHPHMTDYGRVVIFEHAIAYLDAVHRVAHGALNAAFYTYHDALRVYFMASQLLAVLRDAEDILLSNIPVIAPPLEGQQPQFPGMMLNNGMPPPPPPPPLPADRATRSAKDHIERTISCLQRVKQTLGTWGERWVDSKALGMSFESLVTPVLERLEERKTRPPPPPAPPIVHQVHQMRPMQHMPGPVGLGLGMGRGIPMSAEAMRWVDMSTMMGAGMGRGRHMG